MNRMNDLKRTSIIDIGELLEPISAERPVGESLRYEGTYDRIQEARREDDQRLSQGIYRTHPKQADWEADERSYSYADWERACHFENLARKDPGALQEALANIDPTVGSFQNAIAFTDASFHGGVVKDLICAVDACSALQKLLDEKCGRDSPSLHQFNEVLSTIKRLMSQSLHARQDAPGIIDEESDAPST